MVAGAVVMVFVAPLVASVVVVAGTAAVVVVAGSALVVQVPGPGGFFLSSIAAQTQSSVKSADLKSVQQRNVVEIAL